jgi:hypothetical protein
MEQMPQPIDVNKLKNILGNAKKIMQVTESGNYKTGNIDSTKLVQDTSTYVNESNMGGTYIPETYNQSYGDPTRPVNNYNQEMIQNSRLPEAIKQAMLAHPIPQTTMNHTFSLDDVSDLIDEKPMPTPQARRNVVNEQTTNHTNHSNNSNMVTIDKNELRDVIKDVLIEYLTQEYSKNLTENVIKKTINTLIKEGKVSNKKSV